MDEKLAYLLLEALVVFALVLGVHALRRRTSLVYSYAVLAFMRLGSWIATRHSMVAIGDLHLNVGSNIFFTATLLGVFLLYVADGRFAGRAALVVVVGSGLLYALMATMMHAQFPAFPDVMFPASGLRASLASIAASLLDLLLLGLVWEISQRRLVATPLLLRVFVTLAVVLTADGLVYVPVAHRGGGDIGPELAGILFSRALVAAVLSPIVAAYLAFEIRRYGLRLEPRAILSIILSEDAERELVAARHQLRVGTEALWESEERYRRMVEDIPLMVFRFSSDGRVIYANRALCQYYDRKVEELLGLPVLMPIEGAERDRLWSTVMALSPETPTVELEAHATPSRGTLRGQRRTQRWVVRGIFSPSGERLAFQAVGKDVTREVELEAKAVDSERMQAISRMAAGVAHDFNNLIFVIWSCVESAHARLPRASEVAAPLAADLLDIRHAADRAAALTRQLVAVGRALPVQTSAVDLSALVNALRPLLRRLLPGTIALDVRCPPGLPNVRVDPAQIERVVINLVTNARDAMPSGGSLAVATRAQTSEADSAKPSARWVVLSVADTGAGMDPETVRRIFEPFFTTKPDGAGSGLGLSTAYGIVDQAGGHIRVDSLPGAGTTFGVCLPAADEKASETTRRAPSAELGPILYCEGEDGLRAQVTELLENAGYRVVDVRDAEEALAFVRGSATGSLPSALLVDVVAGDLPGPALAARLRQHQPDLPAVFLSGSPDASPTADGQTRAWYVSKRKGTAPLLTALAEATAARAAGAREPEA